MRMIKALGLLAAGVFAFLGLYSAVSAGAFGGASPGAQSSTISPDERAARDQLARQALLSIQATSAFAVRLPASLPAGYTYDRVMWDSSRPEVGFAAWLAGPDSTTPPVQLLEAPYVAGAPKSTLNLPGLTPLALVSGSWQMLQKSDQPGKGLWILVSVQSGVQIEVDGPPTAAVAIANQV
jgi:hypothetical protein